MFVSLNKNFIDNRRCLLPRTNMAPASTNFIGSSPADRGKWRKTSAKLVARKVATGLPAAMTPRGTKRWRMWPCRAAWAWAWARGRGSSNSSSNSSSQGRRLRRAGMGLTQKERRGWSSHRPTTSTNAFSPPSWRRSTSPASASPTCCSSAACPKIPTRCWRIGEAGDGTRDITGPGRGSHDPEPQPEEGFPTRNVAHPFCSRVCRLTMFSRDAALPAELLRLFVFNFELLQQSEEGFQPKMSSIPFLLRCCLTR